MTVNNGTHGVFSPILAKAKKLRDMSNESYHKSNEAFRKSSNSPHTNMTTTNMDNLVKKAFKVAQKMTKRKSMSREMYFKGNPRNIQPIVTQY